MKIQLRPLVRSGLCQSYARDMGNKKVRHYIVSAAYSLINRLAGKDTETVVREFIQKTENESDIEFLACPSHNVIDSLRELPTEISLQGSLPIADISSVILSGDPDLKKSLTKVRAYSSIHQTNYHKTVFHRLYDQYVVHNVNRFLSKLFQLIARIDYGASFYYFRQLNYTYERVLNFTGYIAISFPEHRAEQAVEALLADLRTLQKKGLIMGNLGMPSMMALADLVGVGPKTYCVFCFPIIDAKRLEKITGLTGLALPRAGDQLRLVGVRYETGEGGVVPLADDGSSSYAVEEIHISEVSSEDIRQQVIDTYESTKQYVNETAKNMKTKIDKYEKIESRSIGTLLEMPSNDPFNNALAVDVTLLNKETGELVRFNKYD